MDRYVERPPAQRLTGLVQTVRTSEGRGCTGDASVETTIGHGTVLRSTLAPPPGSPQLAASEREFAAKFADCGADAAGLLVGLDRKGVAQLMRHAFPVHHPEDYA
ncbi:hypothetical protein [Streptomyces sp900116325]|uniref:Uncharacterized protein n=1 Tax=Streptomyces sp. 900116325 TaxID=3154295 RepID=A0ABV2UME0_9ACTN